MHALAHVAVDAIGTGVLDPKSLIRSFGLLGVFVIVFAETGLLVGFFLPGDSLLFLAGIAASPVASDLIGVHLPLPALLVGAPLCAVAGAQLGHLLGARYGRRMFAKPDSRLFKAVYVERAEYYFNRYGRAKSVVLARFIPVVRTFLNPVAGILRMPAGRFLLWNAVGGVVWADGVVLAGYLPAKRLRDSIGATNIDKYLLPAIAVIVLISVTPVAIELIRGRRRQAAAATGAPGGGLTQSTEAASAPDTDGNPHD
ncbi:DedA family protein [Rugosimonospora africana]|uniref:Membrane protein n=1 Tax=Rugosimonospora africana TaxID=556532 RepID=A0A8J3QSQ9_9ACTN|nr:DedA family protein [Rugosimonospora africana]GIH15766.1 membrane protein [Rugosimonospora africana]